MKVPNISELELRFSSNTSGKKQEKPAQQQAEQGDSLLLSSQAQELVKALRKAEQKNGGMDPAEIRRQIEAANEQGEAVAKTYDVMAKCLLIASRIMSGDEVPQEDQQYLMEKNMEMYARAIMLRREKEDPEKCKRLTEDEEEPPVEMPELQSTGEIPDIAPETPPEAVEVPE